MIVGLIPDYATSTLELKKGQPRRDLLFISKLKLGAVRPLTVE